MKNSTECSRKLNRLLKRLGKPEEPELPGASDPVAVVVLSFLMWESTTPASCLAYNKLTSAFVDYNELRVSLPHEMVEIIGSQYPRGLDRCQRLRATLNDIYRRETVVSLERLREAGKRDVRKYLDGLDGIVPYVAARAALLGFEAHALPVDDQLRVLLIAEGAADPSVEPTELGSWLTRQIKAGGGRGGHFAFQAMVDNGAGRASAGEKKTNRSSTTRKKTSVSTTKQPGGKKG